MGLGPEAQLAGPVRHRVLGLDVQTTHRTVRLLRRHPVNLRLESAGESSEIADRVTHEERRSWGSSSGDDTGAPATITQGGAA
jgi:hypothetical protein